MENKFIPGKKDFWKYSFLSLAGFLFILILFDQLIGNGLHYFYFKMKSGVQHATTYTIEETKADIIVFGSSRAVHHYHPDIFENRFKMTFHNAGKDGEASSLFHFALLKGILKRYHPKMLILDLMNGELGTTLYSYEKLASLAPYYKTHPEMHPIIELRSNNEKIKMISGVYPFNSCIMSIISGNLDREGKKNIDYKGYLAVSSKSMLNKPIQTVNNTNKYALDSIKVNVLESFIKECNLAKIKLYIVCSPIYEKALGTDLSMIQIKNIAAANKVSFFNFSQESIFLEHPKLFADPIHLNDNGAKVFSKMVGDSIEFANKNSKVQY